MSRKERYLLSAFFITIIFWLVYWTQSYVWLKVLFFVSSVISIVANPRRPIERPSFAPREIAKAVSMLCVIALVLIAIKRFPDAEVSAVFDSLLGIWYFVAVAWVLSLCALVIGYYRGEEQRPTPPPLPETAGSLSHSVIP